MRNKNEIGNHCSYAAPFLVKVFWSFFMWFPLVISYVIIWYFPTATVYYNVILLSYLIIVTYLSHATCFIMGIKQKKVIRDFINNSQWVYNMKKKCVRSTDETIDSNQYHILHIVIIPVYKEQPSVVEQSIQILSKQHVPMIIGLALEERDHHSDTRYNHIIDKYEHHFIRIIKTIHPDGLENEIQGRASNCNFCVRYLVKYYEESNLKSSYPHVMITTCDADSVWCKNYFLYLNYLCIENGMNNFNSIVYTPSITNLKYFRSYDFLANWMSMARLWFFHGHFRFMGFVRCFITAFHIPLQLLKQIDYFDPEFSNDDTHLCNKVAILDKVDVSVKHVLLPCDNQTPTGTSLHHTFVLLWQQTIRWNLCVYDMYYLMHQLILNIRKIKRYQYFRTNKWKIVLQIMDNYENFFFYDMCFISNIIFWLVYFYHFHQYHQYYIVSYFFTYILPMSMIIQAILTIVFGLGMFTVLDDHTKGIPYYQTKQFIFLTGAIVFPYFVMWYQGINVFIAWLKTFRMLNSHAESAPKLGLN